MREMVKEVKAVEGFGPLKNAKVTVQYSWISLLRNHRTEVTKNTGTIIPPKKATTSLPDNLTIRTKLIINGIRRNNAGVYRMPAHIMKKAHRKGPALVPEIKAA